MKKMIKKQTSKSSAEIAKFELIAEDWWNPVGKFKPLHDITPLRIEYILEQLGQDELSGLTCLDVGCGGGIVSESLARLGGKVKAIDASEININIAKQHAKRQGLDICYQYGLIEDLKEEKYNLVLALEIVEHVEDLDLFINSCCKLVAAGGLLILSTMNRTIRSFLESIIAAEYILQWVPKATHDWNKFIEPAELVLKIERENCKLLNIKGIKYSILKKKWYLSDKIDNNYLICFQKQNNLLQK